MVTLDWIIYPPPSQSPYNTGDKVFIRSKTAKEKGKHAIVIEDTALGNANPKGKPPRLAVRMLSPTSSTTTRLIPQNRLLPIYTQKSILLTAKTTHYRLLSSSQTSINSSSDVLEIGSSFGECSRILLRYAARFIGCDTSRKALLHCRQTYPRESFEECDPLANPCRLVEIVETRLGDGAVPDVVFIDIGGDRQWIAVAKMIRLIQDKFDPLCIVVKSEELVKKLAKEGGIISSQGVVSGGGGWWKTIVRGLDDDDNIVVRYAHPLQAPLVISPTDGTTPICRYFNFHPDGCRKGDECPYDHKICHSCLKPGHVAKSCKVVT